VTRAHAPRQVIDRILQKVFNTHDLKTSGVDSSELLLEVYDDYMSVIKGLVLEYKIQLGGGGMEGVEPPAKAAAAVPERGQRAIPGHARLSAEAAQGFNDASFLGQRPACAAMAKARLLLHVACVSH
jgi:hypothetical protein